MAKIALVISIIVTLATAGLAFMTRKKVDDLQSTLKTTKSNLASTQATLKKTQGDLDTRTGELATANKEIEDRKSEISKLTTDLTSAKSELDTARAKVTETETKIATLQAEIVKLTPQPGMSAEEIAAQRTQMEAEIARLKTEVAEQKQVVATMTDRVTTAEGAASAAKTETKRYTDVVARQGLQGRVVAVNPGWNFVVVDVGDRQGSMINAPMLVMRDGQAIARLKITSVEPTSSIADVVPGTIARGQSVQPGDRVVFARQTTSEVPAQPAGAAGAAQPQGAGAPPVNASGPR